MAVSNELKKIKKVYGERFMHMCRGLFPTLLEHEGKLYGILTNTFSENCNDLYESISSEYLEEEFKSFIYSKVDVESIDKENIENKTPYELLDEAGYELFECKTEEEIQSFKKYYAKGEALCTFNGGRLNRCEVFFAVRKDVDNIKREDYENPKREDEYGTSVMGIQFTNKGVCTVSIKNRYNHTVNNPDATYGNNLDQIVPGLTDSFANLLRDRGLILDGSNIERFNLPNYVVASDGKYYKYNSEINGTYYCPGNIVIDNNQAVKIGEPEKKILMDGFVLDLENKTIEQYDKQEYHDSFLDAFQNIEKINVVRNKEKGTRNIFIHTEGNEVPAIIELNKDNAIISYENENLYEIGNDFFKLFGSNITKLNLPNVREIGMNFMYVNTVLNEFNAPNVRKIGHFALRNNGELTKLDLPNLQDVGRDFLHYNQKMTDFNTPNLINVGPFTLYDHQELNVKVIEDTRLREEKYKKAQREKAEEMQRQEVTTKDIAFLDKENKMTTQEVDKAGNFFERFITKAKSIIKRINKKDKEEYDVDDK